MISGLTKRVAAAFALHRHNKQNRLGVISPDAQDYFVIPDVLPADIFQEALEDLEALKANWVRSNTEWRQGAAIGGHELRAGSSWLPQSRESLPSILHGLRCAYLQVGRSRPHTGACGIVCPPLPSHGSMEFDSVSWGCPTLSEG